MAIELLVLPGDGIGPEITAATVAVLEAADRAFSLGLRFTSAEIGQVSEIARTIASAVEEQGAATQEISRNVQQAAHGTSEVSTNITGVTAAAGETGQAPGQVLSAAGEMARQADSLRQEVERFLAEVKAA